MAAYGRERAVSPVVGVMLMLAITVMIAAIASAFAGSFSDTGEKSPQSSISVPAHLEKNVTGSTGYYRIYFDHTGGDPFSLNSIQVVLRSDETENKTQLTRQDMRINNFTLIGEKGPSYNDTTVRAGDRFFIAGEQVSKNKEGNEGIKFGNVIFWKNKELTWMVIDSRTGKTIAMGSIFPQ